MNKSIRDLYETYNKTALQAADLNSAAALLAWDQETYMPPKSATIRGQQLSTLAGMAHDLLTSKTYASTLLALGKSNDLEVLQMENIRLSKEDYDKNKKFPSTFVERMMKASSSCFQSWIVARSKNDFKAFEPELEKMISLKKEQAELLGYEIHPYDALLDEYEKGATVGMLEPVFKEIKDKLPSILNKINSASPIDDALFHQHFAKENQFAFSVEVLRAMGFDFAAGRQDYSAHPFTTSFGPADVRITTRVDEDNLASLLWSSIHEGGHALYEQGLPESEYGMPLGSYTSIGIHESQSRLWENEIGRGLPFWKHFFPLLQAHFPDQLKASSAMEMYKACNKVSPSLIRTEADEITYHFHVLIRYELEKQLMEGTLHAADLPHAWNELYKKYLGITVPSFDKGVLQDVHWSHGSFGYFPTYSLGSFYAAQFYEQALLDIPDLENQFSIGTFSPMLGWLRERIHQHGRRYTSEELCKKITGTDLDISIFLNSMNKKYAAIYGFPV